MKFAFATAAAMMIAASAQALPLKKVETDIGSVLTADNGMTLYTFTKDGQGVSNCYDGCAAKWPPYLASANDAAEGGYTVISRSDGTLQWAKDGAPLYFWVNDAKVGDTTGDGVGGVWLVARP